MTKKRYKRYSPEFKREALKRASEDGVTDIIVCEELGISARQLRRWRDESRLLGDGGIVISSNKYLAASAQIKGSLRLSGSISQRVFRCRTDTLSKPLTIATAV